MKKVSPRSRAYRSVAHACGHYAVCLIGWEGPRPAFFGDNEGIWPVRIATSARETTAADRADLESPHVGVVVLEYVLVPSEAHAKRLREALDEVLLGEQESQQNSGARHRWRNVNGCWEPGDDHQRAIWWSVVIDEARRLMEGGAREFTIYETAEDAQKVISRKVVRGRT